MKRVQRAVFCLIFSLSIAARSFGQDDPENLSFRFKLKWGGSYTWLHDDEGTDPRIRTHAGLGLDFKVSSKSALGTELIFSQQGGIFTGDDSQRKNFNYLSVPCIMAYELNRSGNFLFHGGLQYSHLVSAKYVTENDPSRTIDVKDTLNQSDFAFVAGMSFIANDEAELTLRYVHGLTSISDSSLFDQGLTNRGIQVSFAFFFK